MGAGRWCSKDAKGFALPQPCCPGQGCVVSRCDSLSPTQPGCRWCPQVGLEAPHRARRGRGARLAGRLGEGALLLRLGTVSPLALLQVPGPAELLGLLAERSLSPCAGCG